MNKIIKHKQVISEIKKLRNVLLEAEVDKSTHVNANSVRTYLSNLGYKVKPTLDEVGDITPEFASVLKKVSSAFKKEMPDLEIRFGSGRDKFHQAYPSSRHNKGNANDIVFDGVKRKDDETLDKICTLLCAARKSIPGFTFIDEYRHPTPHATGEHFHISYSENKNDESRYATQFCNSIPSSNLDTFEFTEPEPEWVNMSQSEVEKQIEKIFGTFGVEETSKISTESDCEDYVKDFIDAFGDKNIIKADKYCDYEIFGYKVKELAKVADEVAIEIEQEEEIKKKEEEKEASLTEELKNFKRFIK